MKHPMSFIYTCKIQKTVIKTFEQFRVYVQGRMGLFLFFFCCCCLFLRNEVINENEIRSGQHHIRYRSLAAHYKKTKQMTDIKLSRHPLINLSFFARKIFIRLFVFVCFFSKRNVSNTVERDTALFSLFFDLKQFQRTQCWMEEVPIKKRLVFPQLSSNTTQTHTHTHTYTLNIYRISKIKCSKKMKK